jgi:hypothetical protein
MIKLHKIIFNLEKPLSEKIEADLLKTKADNFLFLFRSYRSENPNDPSIIESLGITSNSFYVLKSRLYDKIQDYLSSDIHAGKEEVIKQLHLIHDMCYTSSREVTIAFLHKLEKDLLFYDMHGELLVVYSALKKMHLYSDKYFHYSQLYNKHIAFGLSLEKSEETLGNFNVSLGQYDFSRSGKLLETLHFLQKGIEDHYSLNPSRQVEIIKNIIEIQLSIFCNSKNKEHSTEKVLLQTEKMIQELPESSPAKNWTPVLNFLFFEYYNRSGEKNQANNYFEKTNSQINTLLLSSNVGLTSQFLMSKVCYAQENNRLDQLEEDFGKNILFDPSDTHTEVLLSIYNAMIMYYRGSYKEATAKLNDVLNMNSFKDFFHINTEIKLCLVYFYILLKEYDLADNILKNVYRKIKSEEFNNYSNILDLIKVFSAEIKQPGGKASAKQKDYFALFTARTNNENKMLNFLMHELKKRYA